MKKILSTATILLISTPLVSMQMTLQKSQPLHLPPSIQNLPPAVTTYLEKLPRISAILQQDKASRIFTFVKLFSQNNADCPWRPSFAN